MNCNAILRYEIILLTDKWGHRNTGQKVWDVSTQMLMAGCGRFMGYGDLWGLSFFYKKDL